MHKSLWLGLVVLVVLVSPVLGQSLMTSDGFESGTFTGGTGWINGGWTNTGSVAIQGWSNPYEGNRHVWLRSSGASMTRSVSTTNTDGVTINFASRFLSLCESCNARLLVNDVLVHQWNQVDTHTDWRVYSFNVSGVGDSAIIRFEGNMLNLGQEFHVDDIKIYSLEGGSPDPSNETPGVLYEAGSSYYIEKLENGAFRIVVGDAITYYDGVSYLPVWRNIYNLSQFEFENYDYGVETLKYNAYFKRQGGNVQLVSFVSNDTRVVYQPQVIGWINVWDGRENIAMPQTSNSTIHESRITYEDLYGEGIDLSYRAYGNYIRKEIMIENKSNLVPPSEFALSQGPVVFYAEYLLTISNVDRIVVDGVDWDFTGSVSTNNSIEIVNDVDNVLFKIKEPFVIDANNQRFNASYQLFEESGSLRIRIIVPYETLWEDVVYPIIIDPTTGYDDEEIPVIVLNLTGDELSPLEQITLYNVSGEGNLLITNNLTDTRDFSVSYALDPEDLQFYYGEVQVKEAQGDLLLKCVDWDFMAQECGTCLEYENETCITRNETWVMGGDLVIGQSYNFTFDNVDPAYGEHVLSTGESSTTSTAYVNKATKSFTPQVSGYYVVMSTGALTGSSTAHSVGSRLTVNGTTIAEHQHAPQNTDRALEYPSFSGFTVMWLNANQVYTINVDYKAGGGGSVAYIKDVAIGALYAQEHHFTSAVTPQLVTQTQATYLTLNFTADYTGEHVLLASGESYSGATNKMARVYFYQGATLLDSTQYYPKLATDYTSFGYYKTVNLTQGQNYTYTIQADRDPGQNGEIRNLYLLALPMMDSSVDYNYAESNALSTTTATTDQTKVSFTFTPDYPGQYFLFGSAQISNANNNRGSIVNIKINGTSVCNNMKVPVNAVDWYSVNCLYVYNFTNQSYLVEMTYRNSGPGGTAEIRNARIGVFSVTDDYSASVCDYSGSGVWSFLQNIYCHITSMFSQGDGSNIYMGSMNVTRFSTDVYGFRNMTITNSSTIIIDNSSTLRLGFTG